MPRYFSSIIGTFLLLSLATVTLAQEPTAVDAEPSVVPVVTGPKDVAVGRTLILDASASVGINEDTEYRWYRDGVPQPISRSVEAVYTPERPAVTTFRLVIRTEVDGELIEVETQHIVTAYERKVILIADNTVNDEKLSLHSEKAMEEGVYLPVIKSDATALTLADEKSLTAMILEKSSMLIGAESIVVWADGITGLQSLTRALESDPERLQAVRNQAIVLITDRGLSTISRTTRGPFSVLRPTQIIVTRKEAINPLLSAENLASFLTELQQRDIDFEIIDESSTAVRPWNLLSSLVNYMLTHGVASRTVILLLMLPLIATILAFLKQVIGISTFGLYTPSVLALSFIALGWKVGIAFLIFIIFTGYVTRTFMQKWRLLYIPKVAIIISAVSITLLILLGIGAYFGLTLSGDTIFILLIMSTLSEGFLNLKTEEGLLSAVIGIGETILAALLCVFIVQWSFLQSVVLAYPEAILLTIFVNVFLGKWTGLRLVEYFRFREVFKHLQEE